MLQMKNVLFLSLFILTSFCSFAQLPSWLPSNGLVAWYPFSGNANDGSGHNYNGTVTGASIAPDRFANSNSAYSFNGSSGHISVNDNAALRLYATDFTISAWIYNTATAAVNLNAVLSKRTAALASGYIIGVEGLTLTDPGKILYQVSGGVDPKAVSADSIPLNTWMNIMFTYSFSTGYLNIYFDGLLNSSTPLIPTPNPNSTAPLWIGNDAGGAAYCFNGSIDDIAIYNRILSPCERYELIHQSYITIASQPVNQNFLPGDTVMFTVASPDTCLSYQWQSNCGTGYTNLANSGIFQGVTDDTLIVNGVLSSMNNCKFRCLISSCILCADTSAEAMLNSTSGINQTAKDMNFSVSPSPAHDYITVRLTAHRHAELNIYNASGQLVYAAPVNGSSELRLNIASFPKGLYLLTAHSFDGGYQLVKFIKD
jgi:hypothetical protein